MRSLMAAKLSTAALASLALLISVAASRTPCHKGKWQLGKGVTCEAPIVPKKMCSVCLIAGWNNPGGNFKKCNAIYNIRAPLCQQQLRRYAHLNKKCDKLRSRQIANMKKPENREALDYFVYSLCEMCCDCVPKGARTQQFGWRRKRGKLFKVDRGNCPAHAWYDVCRIWPNAKWILREGEKLRSGMNLKKMKPVCENTRKWRFSKHFPNWGKKAQVFIYPNMRRFYTQYMKAAGCGVKNTWQQCVRLERDQRRI